VCLAIPGQLAEIVHQQHGLALCSDARGMRASVEIALVQPVARDEVLLVHAGTAIARAPKDGATEAPAPLKTSTPA
jgi:hydrogenase assembly chaperone HypC/HupF